MTTCPGCKRFYHEVCLLRGCGCGGKTKGARNRLLGVEFALGLSGLGFAASQRPAIPGSPLFWPAVGVGVVGLLGSVFHRTEDAEEGARGRTAAQLLFLPVLAAVAVVARGVEFPGFIAAVVLGAVGVLAALLALIGDTDRANAVLAVLLAGHAYLAASVVLRPDFGARAVEQLKAVARGKAQLIAPLGQSSAVTHAGGAFQVSGVMVVGGARQAMTSKGAFSAGQTVPDVGKVLSVSDAEVVIQTTAGAQERYPVPR